MKESRIFPCATALVFALLATSACDSPRASTNERLLRITTGSQMGPNNQLGQALSEVYEAGLPGAKTSLVLTNGSAVNVRSVEDGSAEIAISRADVAYLAFKQGTQGDSRAYTHLRAMAVLYANAVHVIAFRNTGIHRVADFAGRRIGIGPAENGTDVIARLILEAAGLDGKTVAEPISTRDYVRRQMDAGIVVGGYPGLPIQRLNAAVGIRLLPIEPAVVNRVRELYPFFHPIVIPKRTYEGQDEDIATVGVDGVLLCRSDLPDDLVYQLTQLFMQSLSKLAVNQPVFGLIDPERSASAPIPLHPGAARFYRERELFR